MADEDVTLGELSRNITAMRGDFDRRFMEVNRRLDGLQFVNRDTYTVEMGALRDRVEDLEESKKWTARMLATAFFVAFIAPVLVALVVTRG